MRDDGDAVSGADRSESPQCLHTSLRALEGANQPGTFSTRAALGADVAVFLGMQSPTIDCMQMQEVFALLATNVVPAHIPGATPGDV